MALAALEAFGVLVVFAVLVVVAQRGRVRPATQAVLAAAGAEVGLTLEAGAGTCRLVGELAGHGVEVHRVVAGWAITVHGVTGLAPPPPPAQLGAGRLQVPAPVTDAATLARAIRDAVALVAPVPTSPRDL